MTEDISDRIRQLRNELGLSQEQFGKRAGVSKAAVSQWERGLTRPERDALLTLQRNAAVNPQWVADGRGPRFLDQLVSEVREPVADQEWRLPVVGTDISGPAQEWVEAGRPMEWGDRYLEVSIADPGAYALLVTTGHGERLLPGEAILVQPGLSPQPGDEVVSWLNGAWHGPMQLETARSDDVYLRSLRDSREREVHLRKNIALCVIGAVFRPAAVKRQVEAMRYPG